MNNHLSYYIDNFEIRLKGARAARDWDEVDHIFRELQRLYSLDKSYAGTSLAV